MTTNMNVYFCFLARKKNYIQIFLFLVYCPPLNVVNGRVTYNIPPAANDPDSLNLVRFLCNKMLFKPEPS